MQYRLCFRSKITGFEGHGEWVSSLSAILFLVERANKYFTDIEHWYESKLN